MKLFWMIILIVLIIAVAASTANGDDEQQDQVVVTPTRTKTVYGFLDFTTTVSDTVMIFKPSKANGKGRGVGGATRTASVLRSKPAGKNNGRLGSKIDSSPPEPLEASGTLAELDSKHEEELLETSGRSGGGRSRGKPVIRPRPGGEVLIEGSLIHLDEPTAVSNPERSSTERLKSIRRQSSFPEIKGTGSIVSSFPVMHSHVAVSSRVDVRIGGMSKMNGKSSTVPKQVEVRTEMKLAQEQDPKPVEAEPPKKKMPAGQTIVSKTTGTRIQNGMTTVHETSTIGTTIDGQYAHFVQSTSRIFQEVSSTPAPPAIPGSVEVVTELPSLNVVSPQKALKNKIAASIATTTPAADETSEEEEEQEKQASLGALPSLESLFKSVNGDGNEEDLPAPEQLIARKKPGAGAAAPASAPEDQSQSAVVLKPSFRLPTTSPAPLGNLERRTGLASTQRAVTTPRPQRTEEQRWRYSPSAKPKVAIQRTNGGSRHRVTTPPPQYYSGEEEEGNYQPPPPPPPEPEIDPTEVITLRVQTVTPEGYKNIYYEVATIKSPYIMRLGNIRNTRYVTLTKSFTRLFTSTAAPSAASATALPHDPYALPDPEPEVLLDSSQPLPDPENILATTQPYENILKDSSDTATLPAIIVAATESLEGISLQTVTETFSTTELSMKTSVLPYLRGGSTSMMTLTQSYYVTRVVVAVKTVPPEDLYQFIPSKTLTDFATNLQEAGSEHINDRLLPGELEYSENDEFAEDEEGNRHEKRVPAPDGFQQDPKSELASIGQDFDLSQMDRPHHPVDLEPSLVDTAQETTRPQQTPPLPNGFQQLEPSINNPGQQFPIQQQQQQETPVLSPEQLQQLALFRFMNPYAAAGLPFGYPGFQGFGGGAPQVLTTSRPVVRTTDVIKTETVSIWDGVKTIYSTLLRTKGTTVVTETEYGTTTIPAANPLFPQQQFTVTSSPVVTEITTTSTELRIYRIIFRAQTTYTTVTSTTVFPTLVTTYVSSTIPIQPTAFPSFPGAYNPFAAFG